MNSQDEAFAILRERKHLLLNRLTLSDECLIWTGSVNETGYGSVRVGQTSILAHRAAYFLQHGKIPIGMCVCHHCDTPACCNPNHLFIGTHADNMMDMRIKGRRAGIGLGEANGRAKLSYRIAEEIRRLRNSGAMLKELASMYGVGITTISRVCRMENWI